MKHVPSLDDLAVFVAVCQASGFRAAAKGLGLSPSNVSDTVTRLEAQLGVSLLTRSTRSVVPTEAGRELAAQVTPLLSRAHQAIEDVAALGKQVRGLLKLNVTGAVMVDILPPIIDRFLVLHPAVRVELRVENRLVDIVADGCLAGIRYGEHLAQDMIAVPIGPPLQQLAVAASPAYLSSQRGPSHPDELSNHECIRLRFSSGALIAWEFERHGRKVTVDPPSRLVIGVDAASAAIDFARAGRGVVYTFRNWLDPHLKSGELVPVLMDWWLRIDGPKLYFPRRLAPAPLRAFIDLLAEMRSNEI